MLPRPGSLDWKFPLVMSGLILATAALFVWAAHAQFSSALVDAAGERMRAGATAMAPVVGGPSAARRAQTARIVDHAAVRDLLRRGRRAEAAESVVVTLTHPVELAPLRIQLVALDGTVRLDLRTREVAEWPTWADERMREAPRHREPEYSPFFAVAGEPVYQVLTSVIAFGAEPAADSVLGYLVETRSATRRGQQAIRQALGGGRLALGTPGVGVWTDFRSVLPQPQPVMYADTVMRFSRSPSGPGVGATQAVPGTPWLVWMETSRADAIAPVNAFIWRIIPIAGAIALLGALLVWLLSRQVTSRLVALTLVVDRMETVSREPPAAEAGPGDEIARLERAFARMAARVDEQQRLEQQMMQSQRIEAVGRLAGGIAHDFNNLLTVVRNYSELVREELPGESPALHDIEEVLRATERAATLTRQLLAFSRKQAVARESLDLNEVIVGSQRMLTRVIPSHVRFETLLDPGIARISADRGQLEQVLMNLALNAADAMPDGGRLRISTSMAGAAEPMLEGLAAPGMRDWVRLEVADTGAGMDRETAARIFEPFFTTKPVGKGTGLGLATVHGVVTQGGGRIDVRTELGAGTTFVIDFPAIAGTAGTSTVEAPTPEVRSSPSGEFRREADVPVLGTVLIVEDDPSTREVTRRILRRAGYRLLEAEHGAAALGLLGDGAVVVDLVLSDVMMPGMSGVELADRIADRWPRLPVLLMSGYSDAEIRAKGEPSVDRPLLEKPFTAARLVQAVRAAMGDRVTSAR